MSRQYDNVSIKPTEVVNITPYQRHHGLNIEVLTKRQDARLKLPQRWSIASRNWRPENEVSINPIG